MWYKERPSCPKVHLLVSSCKDSYYIDDAPSAPRGTVTPRSVMIFENDHHAMKMAHTYKSKAGSKLWSRH